jgi:hypothetical protein
VIINLLATLRMPIYSSMFVSHNVSCQTFSFYAGVTNLKSHICTFTPNCSFSKRSWYSDFMNLKMNRSDLSYAHIRIGCVRLFVGVSTRTLVFVSAYACTYVIFFLHFMNIDELLLYTSGMACTYVCGQYKESSYGCIIVLISINMTCYVAYKCSNFYHYGTCSLI